MWMNSDNEHNLKLCAQVRWDLFMLSQSQRTSQSLETGVRTGINLNLCERQMSKTKPWVRLIYTLHLYNTFLERDCNIIKCKIIYKTIRLTDMVYKLVKAPGRLLQHLLCLIGHDKEAINRGLAPQCQSLLNCF